MGEKTTALKRWDTEQYGTLSESSIRESLEHPERYYTNTNGYTNGTAFSGWNRLGLIYVIRGKCKYTHEGGEFVLSELDYCEIPEGNFRIEVLGDEDYEEVRVWRLPEAFWQP